MSSNRLSSMSLSSLFVSKNKPTLDLFTIELGKCAL